MHDQKREPAPAGCRHLIKSNTRRRAVWVAVLQKEPLTQLKSVDVENMVDEYREKARSGVGKSDAGKSARNWHSRRPMHRNAEPEKAEREKAERLKAEQEKAERLKAKTAK